MEILFLVNGVEEDYDFNAKYTPGEPIPQIGGTVTLSFIPELEDKQLKVRDVQYNYDAEGKLVSIDVYLDEEDTDAY